MADNNATRYFIKMDIDLNRINQPIICLPNDPDHACLLSEAAHCIIDEVFIGFCMTNIKHFSVSVKLLSNYSNKISTRLWLASSTRIDAVKLIDHGYYEIFYNCGACMEVSGCCSLCMGNQVRVATHWCYSCFYLLLHVIFLTD